MKLRGTKIKNKNGKINKTEICPFLAGTESRERERSFLHPGGPVCNRDRHQFKMLGKAAAWIRDLQHRLQKTDFCLRVWVFLVDIEDKC